MSTQFIVTSDNEEWSCGCHVLPPKRLPESNAMTKNDCNSFCRSWKDQSEEYISHGQVFANILSLKMCFVTIANITASVSIS